MKKEEKIKKVYQKFGVTISNESIEEILYDNKRTKALMRIYKQEEINSMNYILGKTKNNNYFTKFELEAMSQIDLFDKKVIDVCRIIWKNKDDEKKLNSFLKQLEESRCYKC